MHQMKNWDSLYNIYMGVYKATKLNDRLYSKKWNNVVYKATNDLAIPPEFKHTMAYPPFLLSQESVGLQKWFDISLGMGQHSYIVLGVVHFLEYRWCSDVDTGVENGSNLPFSQCHRLHQTIQ